MRYLTVLQICCFGMLCITITHVQSAPGNSEITAKDLLEKLNYSFRTESKGHLELKQDLAECENLLETKLIEEIAGYQVKADQIIEAATVGAFKGRTYDELTKFVDRFGQRLSGSQSLEDSIDYMLEKMRNSNYSKAWGEEAIVSHWIRGEEAAQMLTPRKKNLAILGLGNSVGTPVEGLTAEVLVVRSFDDLTANAEKAKGKIVVFNQNWISYQESVAYRAGAANAASRVGAVAALVRSIAPFSLNTPHAGGQNYEDGVVHIPVACMTIEDAELLDRMYNSSSDDAITIHLKMLDYNLPMTTSRNVIGELTGSSKPEEIVILSGHIDSWDVGQGAMDDGGGCLISTEAVALLKHLNLIPKRSIQAVLWTAEEVGVWGVREYIRHHQADLGKIVAAFESDTGTFTPRGLDFAGLSDKAGCIINEILKLTASINTTIYERYPSVSSDISLLIEEGVPGLSLNNENTDYFWYHHTESDTMTMMNSEDLDKGMALWAVVSYVIADLNITLPRTADA